MIRICKGDILTVKAGIIVHGCNARGVMGSGLAKQVKSKWPGCFEAYKQHLMLRAYTGKSSLGDVVPYEVADDLIVANAITQQDFGREPGRVYVDYAAVETCFRTIAEAANKLELPVHYPMIGAGLGGGSWDTIEAAINLAFQPFPEVDRFLWIYDQ